jgi:hypothetical protein
MCDFPVQSFDWSLLSKFSMTSVLVTPLMGAVFACYLLYHIQQYKVASEHCSIARMLRLFFI